MFVDSHLNAEEDLNVIISQCKVSFSLMKIIGLLPISISHTGKVSYKIISFASLYSCMVFTIGAYSSIIQLAEEFQMILEQNGYRFSQTLCSVAMMVMLINWLIVPLVFWFSIGKFIRFINSVGVFQKTYYEHTGCKLHINVAKRVNIASFASVCWSIFSWIGLTCSRSSPGFLLAFNLLVWIVNINFASLFWALLCLILKEATVNLSLFYIQSICSKSNTSERINKSVKLWLMLRSLITALADAFTMFCLFYCSILILMTMVMSFQFVLHIYLPQNDDDDAGNNNNGDEIIYFGILTLLPILVIFIIIYFAHLVSREAGLNFQKSTIRLNLNTIDLNTQNQVFSLLYVFEYGDPVITICGFTKLSPPFLTSMLATSIAYIVILLQFSVS